jgi:hypothetical protein
MINMTVMTGASLENEYFAEVILVDGVYSDAIRIPGGDITSICYDLETDGEAVIETTISPDIDSAIWREVGFGAEISPAVKAIRAKATGATGSFIVWCQ